MLLFKRVQDIQQYLNLLRQKGVEIGFAPTMGALHAGHTALITRSKAENQVTVCSIFVNPTQFNDPADLEKYPRTVEHDIEMLVESGCDVLFLPTVAEIYPQGTQQNLPIHFGRLDKVLEGVFRPGHFNGMAQVVYRLLEIVQPNRLYMGQKDFQQLAIVRSLLSQMRSGTELVMCATKREKDGLAMSSRNVRLNAEARAAAPLIHQMLTEALEMTEEYSPSEIQRRTVQKLKEIKAFNMEYFEIVDGHTLMPIRLLDETDFAVAVTAVWVGGVRLIDNLILKQNVEQEVSHETGETYRQVP
jgi:pantoate--beta-alanine ligase